MTASKSTRSAGNKASALLRDGERALVVRIDGINLEENNLRRMVQFAEIFPDEQIVVSVIRQLKMYYDRGVGYFAAGWLRLAAQGAFHFFWRIRARGAATGIRRHGQLSPAAPHAPTHMRMAAVGA